MDGAVRTSTYYGLSEHVIHLDFGLFGVFINNFVLEQDRLLEHVGGLVLPAQLAAVHVPIERLLEIFLGLFSLTQ